TRGILNRLGGNYRGLPPFRHWQAPRHVVWGLAVAMVMLIFAEKNELQMTKNIGLNLQILTSSVLFVCGLSLLAFWLSRYRLARFLRVIILVFVAVNGFLSQLAILAAIADVVFDFRKLRNRNQLGG
ncbi:MAG: YybS family protein, partial [Negativicutes bacterium]|nr:YybS family protein [Negativicutes bacterium]